MQQGKAQLLLALMALICCACLPLNASAQTGTEPSVASAAALPPLAIELLREELQSPALVIGLAGPGGSVELFAAGQADVAALRDVTAADSFGIGSITKLFVAVCVLQMAEEGLLSLDDPLSKYFPSVPDSEAISLRMLLNHTSGLFDYADLKDILPLPLMMIALSTDWQPEDVVEILGIYEPYFAPGTDWHYSNTNYVLLGLIIEQVSGRTAAEELSARIFTPLGMDSAVLLGKGSTPSPQAVHGYELVDGRWMERSYWENPSLAWTAGGITANSEDLLKFARALFGGGHLLSPESMLELLTGVERPQHGSYGLGTMIVPSGHGLLLGHEGMTLGFRTALWYLPQQDYAFVLLSNMSNAEIGLAYDDIAEAIELRRLSATAPIAGS